MKRFKILVAITLLLSACSNDDTDTPVVDEFGTIKAVVTITEGIENFDINFVTSASPASSRITYENTGEKYENGPSDVEQADTKHTFTTTSDASNIGFSFLVLSSDQVTKFDLSYKIEVFFNDNIRETKTYDQNTKGFDHTFGWGTKNGLVEQYVDP